MTISLESATVEQLRPMAHGALAQQDIRTAILLFRRITELEPRAAEDWYQLGLALWKNDDSVESGAALRKAVQLRPKHPQYLHTLATMVSGQGNQAQALSLFRRALDAGYHNPAGAWVEIARIHERMRRPDLARKAVDKALGIQPGHWAAYDVLGDLARAEGDLDGALAHYARALSATSEPYEKASVAHAIGAVHEKRKAWDEAFRAHEQANRFKVTMPIARSLLRTSIQDFQLEFGRPGYGEIYARWASREFDDGLPDPICLVGFPRSGTTMVEQVLAALPGVTTTDEHPFVTPVQQRAMAMLRPLPDPDPSFIRSLDRLTRAQVAELRALYWSEVDKAIGSEARERGDRIVDKHPLRILDVGIINLLFPGAKIVTMLRDPRDCCLSAFFQDLGLTSLSVRFLRLDTLAHAYSTIMGVWTGIREQLAIDWIEMRYEDLVTDFEPNARRLVEFIGEPWNDAVLEFHKKAAKRAINTPSYQAVTEKVNTRAIGKWANYERHLGPLVEGVRPFLDTFGYEE